MMGRCNAGKTSILAVTFPRPQTARDKPPLFGHYSVELWDPYSSSSFWLPQPPITRDVSALLLVFDVQQMELSREGYQRLLPALFEANPGLNRIFVFVHKMDLIEQGKKKKVYSELVQRITEEVFNSDPKLVEMATFYPTTIWTQSLSKAWKNIFRKCFVPTYQDIKRRIHKLMLGCEAQQMVLLEKRNLIPVAWSYTREWRDNHCWKSVREMLAVFKVLQKGKTDIDEMQISDSIQYVLFTRFTSGTKLLVIASTSCAASLAINIQNAAKHFEKHLAFLEFE